MAELTPLVDGPVRRVLPGRGRPATGTGLRLIAALRRPPARRDATDPLPARRSRWSARPRAARADRSLVDEVPAGYLRIATGLGYAPPAALIVLPVLFEDQVLGVIELASFHQFTDDPPGLPGPDRWRRVGVTVNTIIANSRTEDLLGKSQRLTAQLEERSEELQAQQEELQRSNAELEEKAALLARQNSDIEVKNSEIEQARQALEERADQLALASQVQVRVPGQHVARAAHPAQQPADPGPAAGGQHRAAT